MTVPATQKPRCNPEVQWRMLEWCSQFGAEIPVADLSQPNYIYSLALDAMKFEREWGNLFLRLLLTSHNFQEAFFKVVCKTEVVCTYFKCYFSIKYGSRIEVKFINTHMVVLFLRLLRPTIQEVAYEDTFIFRRDMLDICDTMVKCGLITPTTSLNFLAVNNDSAYGTLQEGLRQFVNYIRIDETFCSFLEPDENEPLRDPFEKVEIVSAAKNDVYYVVQYFRFWAKRLIMDEVCGLDSLTEYEEIPVNVYVEETSINMDNSNVAEIQVPALTVIEHSLPNLKKLNLVKNFPSFKVPINGDASFLGKITDAVNTFRVEYQALYENKPYETQFIYNLGCRPHTENNDRRSDRLFTPYIRDVVPAEFIEKTHKNEFVKHYQMVDGNLTFNIYSFSNLQSDEPYKVPRAEDLQ